MEDLNLRELAQTLHLGKNLCDNGFGKFRTLLSYKLEGLGKQLVKIDKWFPSSKRCNKCGGYNEDLKLSDRTFICPKCAEIIDRDKNAAINIRNFGYLSLFA